jgi:hypothetical protein
MTTKYKRIAFGYHVTLTLAPDVEQIIQEQRKKYQEETGFKPPRGVIIGDAVRGFYGANTATEDGLLTGIRDSTKRVQRPQTTQYRAVVENENRACGHQHRSYEAAVKCGVKQFTPPPAKTDGPAMARDAAWYGFWVHNQDGQRVRDRITLRPGRTS